MRLLEPRYIHRGGKVSLFVTLGLFLASAVFVFFMAHAIRSVSATVLPNENGFYGSVKAGNTGVAGATVKYCIASTPITNCTAPIVAGVSGTDGSWEWKPALSGAYYMFFAEMSGQTSSAITLTSMYTGGPYLVSDPIFSSSSVNTSYALSVTKIGSGTVFSAPSGMNCGTSCSASFSAGTSVTLTASPDVGWTFVGWAGCSSTTAVCSVTMNSSTTVTATFALTNTSSATTLSGHVTTTDGVGVSGMKVNAVVSQGTGFGTATTNTDGSYSIIVASGTWEIAVYPESASEYTSPNPSSRRVTVSGTPIAGLDFTVSRTSATISGTLRDMSGAVITGVNAGVYVAGQSIGAPVVNGAYTVSIPPGTYTINVWLPSNSGFSAPESKTVTVNANQSLNNVDFILSATSSGGTFEGTIIDANGPVTNADVEVFAGSAGQWIPGSIDAATGHYRVAVSPGTWQLAYRVTDARYVNTGGLLGTAVTILSGTNVHRDITLLAANATLTVKVQKSDGSAFPNADVEVSAIPFNPDAYTGDAAFRTFGTTDNQGSVHLHVPPGTYYVRAFASTATSGGLNPAEQSVIVGTNATNVLVLQFRSAGAIISGRVLNGTAAVGAAFVGAWSKTGGFATTQTDSNGAFTLHVTSNDVWQLKAGGNLDGVFYEGFSLSVDMTNKTSAVQDLLLTATTVVIPSPASASHNVTQSFARKLDDGTTVACAANCFGSSGTAQISIQPDLSVPDQGTTKIVGIAYNIEAHNASGTAITQLNGSATVTIPYRPEELSRAGMKERDLRVGYFNDTTARWQALDTSVVDAITKTVTATTTHLTRFAILSSAYSTIVSGPIIHEGDLIRGPDGVKVYIVNGNGYKRHIFNPAVFGMYRHFSWSSIRDVGQLTLDSYVTSDLYRADGDPKVYSLEEKSEVQGSATKHWLDMTAENFSVRGYSWAQVFIVNAQERDYYSTGSSIQ